MARPKNKPSAPAKRGRPFKEINVEFLKRMAARHCTIQEMADCMGVTAETLTNNYSQVITEARGRGKLELRDHQWRILEKGSADMAKWLGRAILKQNEAATNLTEEQNANLITYTDAIQQAREEDSQGQPEGNSKKSI